MRLSASATKTIESPLPLPVSIVILSHNGRAYTVRCLESILAADGMPAELIVIDNGSDDGTGEALAALAPRIAAAGIRFLPMRNEENLGCSTARNRGWEEAAAEYVIFLDNDTAIRTRRWLHLLTDAMASDPTLGVLGPKLLYPCRPHPIQCAGVAISPKGRIRFRGRGAPRDTPEFNTESDVQALISACWIMRRRFIEEIGGLDPLFHPVQYEDLDFCLRVTAAGYACRYTPSVEIYHVEGGTTASFGRDKYLRTIAANSTKFRTKWREVLATYPDDDADYRWLRDDEIPSGDELDLAMV